MQPRLLVLSLLALPLVACGDDDGDDTPSEEDAGPEADARMPFGCGDGDIAPFEDCDDGNTIDGDGCGSCQVEGGWSCEASAATGQSECTEERCEENERVASNGCVDCPMGTTNAAGDGAGGPDTACDPTLCEMDQRVVSNACEPCPTGETNEAGDDASGSDTTCDDVCARALGVRCDEFTEAYLKASNTGANDVFGFSIALDGDTLVVGARFEASEATGIGGEETNDAASRSGAVYVFTRTGASWTQQAYLKASNTGADDEFGSSVALDGDTLAVGAALEDSNATGVGGDETNNGAADSGAVYLFTRTGTTWTQQAYLKASNTNASDGFGVSVALEGDTLAVGAFGEASEATGVGGDQTNNVVPGAGAVYVFIRTGATWAQQAYLKASNTGANDRFGRRVALDGDTLAVGAWVEDSDATGVGGDQTSDDAPDSGAVYVFARTGTTWAQQAYLKASNTDADDRFGASVALEGDTLAVGAFGESSDATGVGGEQASNGAPDSGAVYVFTRTGTTWTQQAYLKASNTDAVDEFGFALDLDGNVLAVGAYREDSSATGVGGDQTNDEASLSGAVYLFTRTGTTWTQLAYLKASNTNTLDQFGQSIALDGNTLAVGAIRESSDATGVGGDQGSNGAPSSGAVYVRRVAP